MKLVDAITQGAVVNAVVELRMRQVARRHQEHFVADIVGGGSKSLMMRAAVDLCLPPRKAWRRPGRDRRSDMPIEDHYRIALRRAVEIGLRQGSSEIWAHRLRDLIAEVDARAWSRCDQPLKAPSVRILPRGGDLPKGDNRQYRVISTFEDLADRLLLGFAAKYLVRIADPMFMDCACAFRVSHHLNRTAAVERIVAYMKAHEGERVYAAECDIKSFFDCVPHAVVQRVIREMTQDAAGRGVVVDPGALAIVEQYLAAYDYDSVAEPQATKLVQAKGGGELSRPDRFRLSGVTDNSGGRMGIPQGGALSPLFANLILNAADKAVLGDGADRDMLYLRYCDDMIVLHTDKKKCGAALRRYTETVRAMGFAVHAPQKLTRYASTFFDAKSKLPYRVAKPGAVKSASPWVSFLGYQVGHDGQLRVRKASLDRHKSKHQDLVMRIVRCISKPRARLLKSNDEIVRRVAFRLVAAGVGRWSMRSGVSREKCWMGAFGLLKPGTDALTQMRRLDQHRDRLISKLIGALFVFHSDNHGRPKEQTPENRQKIVPKRPLLGRALSYCGRLIGDVPARLRRVRPVDRGYGRDY